MHHALRLALVSTFVAGWACSQAPASPRAKAQAPGSQGGKTVVATVGGEEITLAEVDTKAIQSNMQAFQQLYDARRQAVEALVSDLLLTREAESRGITKDELVESEITSKVPPVTPEEVEAFFNQNQARLGGQTLEQIGPQIEQYLALRAETTAREAFLERLRRDAEVSVRLDPPRVPLTVASNERIKGKENAEVTIIEYSDFQ